MSDPIRGKTIRWSYDDGPVAGKTFEHVFAADGTVTWRGIGAEAGQPAAGGEPGARYEVAELSDDVYAVSYLAGSGWTLTTIVNNRDRTIASFASDEKTLVLQHGKLV